ncbi:transcription termination/antitermination protein NusG [Sinorhizobium medicae]|uniref:transcription termination/antitermination protein NusG n=1 Tax=Sinorhizobium medicae TaxID=110321 RepID=UPI00119F4026|nr:transcription termination/antitermination NusG family protein [Sinorhizobium medicae]TWA32926.1 transcription termination factor nusG [Sinorhizobium medicae]
MTATANTNRQMAWYVVRTVPGGQKPRREFSVEQTALDKAGRPRGKGYRIVPNLNHNISAIERSLTENGFDCYMPSEKRLIRDRKHTDLWKVRRFALLVGYVFVRDPHDWRLLEATPGVAGVVKSTDGSPLPIDIMDILAVRAAEADAEVEFDRKSRLARQTLRKNAKTDPRLKMLLGKLDIAGLVSVPLDYQFIAA